MGETLLECCLFSGFAKEKRDLLAIFAQACEGETVIGFIALLLEGKRRQRMAKSMCYHSSDSGIDERGPEQEARHGDVEMRQSEIGGKRPQNDRIGHERAEF